MQNQNRNDFLSKKNELKDAIDRGDAEAAYRLMSQGDHINYILGDYIANDDVEGVKLMLQYNFDLDKIYNNGSTALSIAINRGNKEISSLLINKGADPYKALERSIDDNLIQEAEILLLDYNTDRNLDGIAKELIKLALDNPKDVISGTKIIYTLLERGVDVKGEDLGRNHALKEALNAYRDGRRIQDLENYDNLLSEIDNKQHTKIGFLKREKEMRNRDKEDDIRPGTGTLSR